MTREGFKAWLRPRIESGEAFSAYWHRDGFGILKTGPIPTERTEYVVHVPGKPDKRYRDYSKARNAQMNARGAWLETEAVKGKPRTVSAATLKRWKAQTDKLRRRYIEVITVEYDGKNLMVEGGLEL